MFIDASALTALLFDEADAAELLARLTRHEIRTTSPLAVWEAAVSLVRVKGSSVKDAQTIVADFLELMLVEVRPLPSEVGYLALEAFDRYGKGRHPAKLNFGDCFAYACAKHANLPLLYKGDDFPLTDAVPA